jgi:hypothetical protein
MCEHGRVSRTTMLVLVALGAAIAGFAFSSAANRGDSEAAKGPNTVAAGPQKAVLGWRESYGNGGEELIFSVESLEVLTDGWEADISLENSTTTSYEVVATHDRPFGLMLLSTGSHDALEQQNEAGTLPTIRPASRYEPQLPPILEPGDTWSGTISAPGALVANSWVRLVFGALVSVVDRDEGVSWITDQAYRLRP